MAETLGPSSMLPNKFEPKRKYSFLFTIEGIDAFLIKTASRPTFNVAETEIPFINTQRYIAGKVKWDTVSVTLYDAISPSGAQQTMEWLRTVGESVSGRAGYADFYKRDVQIKVLDPVGTVIELWDMKGTFPTSIGYGDLDYSSEDPMEISLTLRSDQIVLQY